MSADGGDEERTYPISSVRALPTTWLWPGRIPRGEVTLIDGDPGLAKTTIAIDLAARVSAGSAMPCCAEPAAEPGNVLFLSAEDDSARTLRPRLEAAGADLERIHLWRAQLPTLPSGTEELVKAALDLGIALVVFDPIVAFLDDDKSAHIDGDVRTSLRLLHTFCTATDAAVLGIRHLNKQLTNGNPLYRGGGSIAWIAMARSGLLVAEHPQDPEQRVLAHGKCNLARRAPSLAYRLDTQLVEGASDQVFIEWLGEVDLRASDLLRPERARAGAASPLQGEIKALVAEKLAAGPRPAADVLAWLGAGDFKSRSIDAATAELVRDGFLKKYPLTKGGAWVWEWRAQESAGDPRVLRSVETAESADSRGDPPQQQSPRSPRSPQTPRARGARADSWHEEPEESDVDIPF